MHYHLHNWLNRISIQMNAFDMLITLTLNWWFIYWILAYWIPINGKKANLRAVNKIKKIIVFHNSLILSLDMHAHKQTYDNNHTCRSMHAKFAQRKSVSLFQFVTVAVSFRTDKLETYTTFYCASCDAYIDDRTNSK